LCVEKGIIGIIMKKYEMLKIDEENYIYSAIKEAFNNKNIEEEDEKETKVSYEASPYNKNVFAAMGCLDLLEKLLNTEYNPDYEIYFYF
jgi:hypothetical protein